MIINNILIIKYQKNNKKIMKLINNIIPKENFIMVNKIFI